jgi:type II secretory pathway pseudopilin PulG
MAEPSMQRRFTFIEFIVILVILGLVAGITVTRFMRSKDKTKVDVAKNDVSSMITALKEFEKCHTTYNLELEYGAACTIMYYTYFKDKLVDTAGHPYTVPDTTNFTNFMYVGNDTTFTINVKAKDRNKTIVIGTPEGAFP